MNAALLAGVAEKTVRNAAKFAQAYEQFKQINPEAAARVVSGEIKDALTRLPTMTEQAMREAAERVMQGETRLAAPDPQATQYRAGEPTRGRHNRYRAHLEDLEGVDDPVLGYASQLDNEGARKKTGKFYQFFGRGR